MIWLIIAFIFLLVAAIIGWSEYFMAAKENETLRECINVLRKNGDL